MAPRIKTAYNYEPDNYLVVMDDSTETVPDLNCSIETLLRDFTRDQRTFDFNDDDDKDPIIISGLTSPSVDPLTDMEENRNEFDKLQKKLNYGKE